VYAPDGSVGVVFPSQSQPRDEAGKVLQQRFEMLEKSIVDMVEAFFGIGEDKPQ
jgi:hypothetical protein